MSMPSRPLFLRPAAFGMALALLCSGAAADNIAVLGGNAFGSAQGNLQLNLVAGAGNAQTNAASLAIGSGADAETGVHQVTGGGSAGSGTYSATIGGNAFGNASGLISVNEASGTNNAQANSIAIGIATGGGQALTGNKLSQVVGGGGQTSTGGSSNDHVAISGNAFAHANGLVQINQAAGTGNASANSFALELNLGGKP